MFVLDIVFLFFAANLTNVDEKNIIFNYLKMRHIKKHKGFSQNMQKTLETLENFTKICAERSRSIVVQTKKIVSLHLVKFYSYFFIKQHFVL